MFKHLPLLYMQVPVTMDQVLLEWNGGHSVVLARVRGGKGCWLCRVQVHRQLGSSITIGAWTQNIKRGEHTSSVHCNAVWTCT